MALLPMKEDLQKQIERLHTSLELAWDDETSATPDDWEPSNPSRGQCAVTALVVNDIFGGELMRTTVGGESHYLNRLLCRGPNRSATRNESLWIDLTLKQFGIGAHYDEVPETRQRSYVMSFPETVARYHKLIASLVYEGGFYAQYHA